MFEGIKPLSPSGERTAQLLTDAANYGGAVAYHAHPCIVVYGVPCWIMPNGMVRVGEPNAHMVSPEHGARIVRGIMRERVTAC